MIFAETIDLPKFVGIPYKLFGRSFDGCDCYGLVCLLYEHTYNIQLPEFNEMCFQSDSEFTFNLLTKDTNWEGISLDSARFGDILLFRSLSTVYHCGICLNNYKMLHTTQTIGSSAIQSYKTPIWLPKLIGVYRYVLTN